MAERARPGAEGLQHRAGLWPLRVAWFALPLILGPTVGPALDRLSTNSATAIEIALWAVWFAGLVAVGAPSALTLTLIRILAPAVVVVAAVAAVASEATSGPWLAAAVGAGFIVTALALSPVVGDAMINGSAYGSERRMALRPPSFVLLGPLQGTWAVMVGTAVAGPLLLATGHWIAGGVVSLAALGAAWLGWRVLHQLSRRWLVFVPAGFVIHDHLLAIESVLLRRHNVAALGPATGEAPDPIPGAVQPIVDLSGGAYGLALEVFLDETVPFGRRRGSEVTQTETARLIFTPTLPGAVLAEARTRAIAIGSLT